MFRLSAFAILTALTLGAAAYGATPAVIKGTAQSDDIQGTLGGDRIYGFAGNDEIDGRGGSDVISRRGPARRLPIARRTL